MVSRLKDVAKLLEVPEAVNDNVRRISQELLEGSYQAPRYPVALARADGCVQSSLGGTTEIMKRVTAHVRNKLPRACRIRAEPAGSVLPVAQAMTAQPGHSRRSWATW